MGSAYGYLGSPSHQDNLIAEPEARLLKAVDAILDGQMQTGQQLLQALIEDQPNFRLANLIYADLLATRAGRLPMIGGDSKKRSNVVALLEEVKRRYKHHKQEMVEHQNLFPEEILQVSSSQKYVIVVDSTSSRTHVFENSTDGLRLISDYYATIGKNGLVKVAVGDKKTPMGVYFITSRLDPLGLDDLYGDGALPLNYPNEWDQRLGRTGYGIWIHGVPSNTYNRSPYATEGCIALPNDDISRLYNTPNIHNTPVIISPIIKWVSAESVESSKQHLLDQIEQWRVSWAAQNTDLFKGFYSAQFLSDSDTESSLLQNEEKISSTLGVAISDISLFKYPATKGLAVATFTVTHWGNEKESIIRLRQYWQRESDNQWRILSEGPATYKPVHFRGIPKNLLPLIAKNTPN